MNKHDIIKFKIREAKEMIEIYENMYHREKSHAEHWEEYMQYSEENMNKWTNKDNINFTQWEIFYNQEKNAAERCRKNAEFCLQKMQQCKERLLDLEKCSHESA